MISIRLGEIANGQNPIAEKKEKRKALSVREFGQEVIEYLKHQQKSEAYVEDCERILTKHVVPAFGDFPVRDVTNKEVERVIRSLRETPRAANKARSFLSRMFKLAVRWGYRPDDPTLGAEKFEERARERFLTQDELGAIGQTFAPDSHLVQNTTRALEAQVHWAEPARAGGSWYSSPTPSAISHVSRGATLWR